MFMTFHILLMMLKWPSCFCQDMLLGGVETSNIVIEWALVELLKNPQIMKKLQYELDHIVGHERIVDEDDIP